MKRLHVHVSVHELTPSIAFYSALFGAEPVTRKPDYAKWLLDDPRVNFAISRKEDNATGLNHLGVQVETEEELVEVYERLGRANIDSQAESCARCCYAQSQKHWAIDPTGIVWEAYRNMGSIAVYGEDRGQHVADVLAERTVTEPQLSADPSRSSGRE
jgi:catechol 2,3-dioxygenase-like lactoylglutathione lyase family enzyme